MAEPEQQSKIRTGIYPGSFDPITNGHLDLIGRAARLADRLIVSVVRNESKRPIFSVEERMAMIRESVAPGIEVEAFDGLLVDYAARRGASFIVRGLRAGDFDGECRMASMNRHLAPGIETVFLVAAEPYSYVSSALVKEVARLGGNISGLVPPAAVGRLRDRVLTSRSKL